MNQRRYKENYGVDIIHGQLECYDCKKMLPISEYATNPQQTKRGNRDCYCKDCTTLRRINRTYKKKTDEQAINDYIALLKKVGMLENILRERGINL